MKLLILNGPNLNLLGTREVDIYGHQTFESYLLQLKGDYSNVELNYYQSNSEGLLIDKLHEVGFSYDGIVFNAGAYTHTSIALADAISAINTPVIEVHLSNIYKRETFRHHSFLSPVCMGCIAGFGLYSYNLAIEALIKKQQ